jgi:hypothetical protein
MRSLTSYDFDLFTISLPRGLLVADGVGEGILAERVIGSRYEKTYIRAFFEPRNTAQLSRRDCYGYAKTVQDAVERAGFSVAHKEGASESPAGNPCFTAENAEWKAYYVFLETEYYFITLHFSTDVAQYDEYFSHFQEWEASIRMNDTPTGKILDQLRVWSGETYEISVPRYYWSAVTTDGADLNLQSAKWDMAFQIYRLTKSTMPNCTNAKEALAEWLGERASPDDIVVNANGNPCCEYLTSVRVVTMHDFANYACCVEGETEYIVATFGFFVKEFRERAEIFQEWEKTLIAK